MDKLLAFASSVAVLGIAAHADAAITVYTSQSAYLAAVANPGTDTFNNLTYGGSATSPATRTAGSYGYTVAATDGFYGAGNSSADVWLSTQAPTDAITFSGFTGGVRGVGGYFFATEVTGTFNASTSIALTARDASGTVTQTILAPTTTSFLGFVSTTGMVSLTVAQPVGQSGGLYATVNDLVLGGAAATPGGVPEPATWAMMIGGFGLIGASLRRRKTAVAFTV